MSWETKEDYCGLEIEDKLLVKSANTNTTGQYLEKHGRLGSYAATKAFVRHFSRALGAELSPRGISVTALCPGWVDTEFVATDAANAAFVEPPTMYRMAFST